MHGALATIVWIVCIAAVVIGFLALVTTRKTWEGFGKDRMLLDSESVREPSAGSSAAPRQREEEIRQMLEARNARRVRRGEDPADIERELSKLTAPAIDSQLREEIRELVEARNYRRMRAGKPPLDVEAEIKREIDWLGTL